MNKLIITIMGWLRVKLFQTENERLEKDKKLIRFTPRVIKLANEPEWTPNHAEALKLFLNAPVGKDLDSIMNWLEIRANGLATRHITGSHEEREYRAGMAFGIAFAYNQLRQMANTVKEEEASFLPSEEETEEIINNRIRGMM